MRIWLNEEHAFAGGARGGGRKEALCSYVEAQDPVLLPPKAPKCPQLRRASRSGPGAAGLRQRSEPAYVVRMGFVRVLSPRAWEARKWKSMHAADVE